MENQRFIHCLYHPEKIGKDELSQLDEWIHQYPYFQAARIVYLKALYLQGEHNFRQELKINTVHITDHKQLLRYLNGQIRLEPASLRQEEVNVRHEVTLMKGDFCTTEAEILSPVIPEEQPEATQTITEAQQGKASEVLCMEVNLDEEPETTPAEMEQPAPPHFTAEPVIETPEILSGMYQLTEETESSEPQAEKKRQQKDDLIEQFIKSEPNMPKISATTSDQRDLSKENPYAQEELFSETLAKIYVRQHLYEKAIATYIKLSLKYPEKSVYFADRIEKIKENINNKE